MYDLVAVLLEVVHIFLFVCYHGEEDHDSRPLVIPGELPRVAYIVRIVFILGLRQVRLILYQEFLFTLTV